MPRAASPRRFAQAVFQIGLENDSLERWFDDLTLMADAVSNAEFLSFLDAPEFTLNQKVTVIKEGLAHSVAPLAANLLSILASRSKAFLLPGVVDQFQRLLNAHRGVEEAVVTTAVALSDEQRDSVTNMLKNMVGKEIRLTAIVNPQIIGGIIAQVGDRVIDGSTRTKLSSMRVEMVERR